MSSHCTEYHFSVHYTSLHYQKISLKRDNRGLAMGILKALHFPQYICLKPVHILGRDPSVADTLLEDESCSRMHCMIRWQNGVWVLVDESTNGCFINEKRTEKGDVVRLSIGDVLAVGTGCSTQWTLLLSEPPSPTLVSDDRCHYIILQALNLLPNEAQPECQILKKGQQWYFDSGHDYYPIAEGFQLQLQGKNWRFYPNQLLDETEVRGCVSKRLPKLTFNISLNQEHVQLIIEIDSAVYDLGQKIHHYLLWEMARYIQQHQHIDISERGWITNDILLHDLGMDIGYFNIQIYRARNDIRKISSYWGENLIERRRGEIRLHPCDVTINQY